MRFAKWANFADTPPFLVIVPRRFAGEPGDIGDPFTGSGLGWRAAFTAMLSSSLPALSGPPVIMPVCPAVIRQRATNALQ